VPKYSVDEVKDKIQSLKTYKGVVMRPWMKRAFDHPELHTKDNESVQSGSMTDDKGKHQLFPNIRLRGPGLEKMNGTREGVVRAFKESMKRKDAVEFDTADQATEFSIDFSNELGRRGQKKKKKEINSNLKQGYLIK